MTVSMPGLTLERKLWAEGAGPVAGLDEAGRGAWAGPVVAGAVILPPDRDDLPDVLVGVRDSKLCTPRQREALYPVVLETALAAAVGVASAREVEEHNVVGATQLAMRRALDALGVEVGSLLIDGRTLRLPTVNVPQYSMNEGERHSLSIAAASILAKVTRDRILIELDETYPEYGFAQHKGYGTRLHRAALAAYGPCEIHRRTYAPIRGSLLDAIPGADDSSEDA